MTQHQHTMTPIIGRRSLNKNHGYILLLFVGATSIAFAPIFAKLAVQSDHGVDFGMSPAAVAFWRLALSFPVFLFMSYRSRDMKEESPRFVSIKSYGLLALPGFFFAADLAAWHWSFEFTSVANATLEANMASVFVALFGWLILKERLSWKFPLGMSISVCGLIGLVLAGSNLGFGDVKGDLLGISTALCYAGYLLSVKMLTNHFRVPFIMLFTTLIGGCVILCGLFIGYRTDILGALLPHESRTWLWLVCLALIPQIAGQALIAKGMSQLPVSFSAISLLWQPMMAAVLGWLILGQPLSLIQVGAGLMILLGIFLARQGTLNS